MKKIFTLVSAIVISNFIWAQVFIDENFDSGIPGTWTVQDLGNSTGDSWTATAAGSNNLDGTDYVKLTFNSDGTDNSQLEYLVSPVMNTSSATVVTLEYDQYLFYDGQDSAKVQVYDGSTWHTVHIVNTSWFGGSEGAWGNPNHPVIDISAYKNANMKVRFEYTDGEASFSFFWAIDNVKVSAPVVQSDFGTSFVYSPISSCSLGDEKIIASFKNFGFVTDSNFNVGFSVDGNHIATETVNEVLAASDSVIYEFNTLADLSATGNHTIKVYTMLSNDDDNSNDTIEFIVNHQLEGTLENYSTEIFPLKWPSGAGAGTTTEIKSKISFCGLPFIDSCLKIKSVTIDSIIHERPDDLAIYLISPDNQDTINLRQANIGYSTTPDTLTNIVFKDTIAMSPKNLTTPFNSGTYHSDYSDFATTFKGNNPNGEWTLWIRDIWGYGAPGTFFSWSMQFEICDSSTLNPPLTVANFNTFTSEVCTYDSVQFVDSSTNSPYEWYWEFQGGSPSTSTEENPKVQYSNSGSYVAFLRTKNIGGVDTISKTINVNLLKVPKVQYTYLINQETVEFTSILDRTDSVFWDFGDQMNSTEFNPVYDYSASGNYTICLEAVNQCGSTTYCDSLEINIDGIKNYKLNSLSIYPNPFKNKIRIQTKENIESIIMYNLVGEIVFNRNLDFKYNFDLTLSEIPSGSYFLSIQTKNEIKTFKVIKE